MLEYGFPVAIGASHGGLDYGFPTFIVYEASLTPVLAVAFVKVSGAWVRTCSHWKNGAWGIKRPAVMI